VVSVTIEANTAVRFVPLGNVIEIASLVAPDNPPVADVVNAIV
jgi:hypothetical protein